MKTYLDCIPCFLNQALRAARVATPDQSLHRRVIDTLGAMIPELPLGARPPEIAQQCYHTVYQITGDDDPFRRLKDEANSTALRYYPSMKKILADSKQPLFDACKLAIAGNSIDYGPGTAIASMASIVTQALKAELVVDHYDLFRKSIESGFQRK